MTADPQVNKLETEILADARTKAERTIARAQNDAEKMRKKAQTLAASKREERLREAEVQAEAQARAILVEVEQEARRHWLLAREKCLDELLDQALEQASQAEGEERAPIPAQPAIEASTLGIASCWSKSRQPICTRHPAGSKPSPPSCSKRRPPSISLSGQPGHPRRPAMHDTDQARRFDNTYASRLRWMKTELRDLAAEPTLNSRRPARQ